MLHKHSMADSVNSTVNTPQKWDSEVQLSCKPCSATLSQVTCRYSCLLFQRIWVFLLPEHELRSDAESRLSRRNAERTAEAQDPFKLSGLGRLT